MYYDLFVELSSSASPIDNRVQQQLDSGFDCIGVTNNFTRDTAATNVTDPPQVRPYAVFHQWRLFSFRLQQTPALAARR
jgi:hypothetical protein